MKKSMKAIALVLVLVFALSTVVVAADETPAASGKKATLSFINGFNGSASFEETEGDYVEVTVNSESFKATDKFYLVLALKDPDNINEDSILYIDQIAAADGSISFKVYPSVMTTSTIVITGVTAEGTTDGMVKVAIINGKYILGDVDGSGEVDVGDATMLLKYLAGLADESEIVMEAANVDKSDDVDVGDATFLLRVLAGLASL